MKRRRQYSLTEDFFKTLRHEIFEGDVNWGAKLPSNIDWSEISEVGGKVKFTSDAIFDSTFISSLGKRELQRMYLTFLGRNSPRGSSAEWLTDELVKYFQSVTRNKDDFHEMGHKFGVSKLEASLISEAASNETLEKVIEDCQDDLGQAFSAVIKVASTPDVILEEDCEDSEDVPKIKPPGQSESFLNKRYAVIEQKVDKALKSLDIILGLLSHPIIKRMALGVSEIEAQIEQARKITTDWMDNNATTAELRVAGTNIGCDVGTIYVRRAIISEIVKRKAFLEKVIDVSCEHGISLSLAYKAFTVKSETGLPIESAIVVAT